MVKMKDFKENDSYQKWMNSKDSNVKERLKIALKKAGIPLEFKARKKLENNGFNCTELRYFGEGVWRQL